MKGFSWRISKMPSQAVSHAQTCHPETVGQKGSWSIGYVELDHLKKVQRIEILIQSEHFFLKVGHNGQKQDHQTKSIYF